MISFADLSKKINDNEIALEKLGEYLDKDHLGIAGVVILKLINENYCDEEIITRIASFSNLLGGYKFVGPWQYGHIAIAALYLLQDNRARDKYVEIYESLSDDDKFLVDNFIETEAYKL